MDINGIKIFKECDPFYIELQIIKLQNLWKFHKYHKSKMKIIKNIKFLKNHCDPISLDYFFFNNLYFKNLNNLYPIFYDNVMYIYQLSSLKELIEKNINEIYLNKPFQLADIKNILYLSKNIKIKTIELTNTEKLYYKKINIFQIFYELGTYFTLDLYENINKNKLLDAYNELNLIWTSFRNDNSLNESNIFGQKIKWNKKPNNVENKLLDNINIMINNNLEDVFKKNICYIIIGAFSYVDKDIKKIYNNIDFI